MKIWMSLGQPGAAVPVVHYARPYFDGVLWWGEESHVIALRRARDIHKLLVGERMQSFPWLTEVDLGDDLKRFTYIMPPR